MAVIVVVGAQFGSEGKGKVVAYLSKKHTNDNLCVVRCGGPNSGHTITINNKRVVLRQIPCGVVNPKAKLFLPAGSLINVDVLIHEIETLDIPPNRLKIDRNCMVIEQADIEMEKQVRLQERIGSTCSGVGYAVVRRILRESNVRLAKDISDLSEYITDVVEELNDQINSKTIIIEGTQGFGLSLYHSPYYPYTTSRDTSAAGFLSEVGISPLLVTDIVLVIRTFPIRVGGNSGPLINEINWNIVTKESNYPQQVEEYTSVTKRLRRVGRFDMKIVQRAVLVNRPTKLAVMGIDYISYGNYKVRNFDDLTDSAKMFIKELEDGTGVKVHLVGTGPDSDDLFEIEV